MQAENISTISPNPTKDIIKINLGNNVETAKIVFYDVQGKIVKKLDYSTSSIYNISDLDKGIYFIKFISNYQIETQKLIIN